MTSAASPSALTMIADAIAGPAQAVKRPSRADKT